MKQMTGVTIHERFRQLEGSPKGDFIDGRWNLGRRDALDRSARLASYFESRGLVPGDTIAVGMRDDAEVMVVFLGCLRSGLVPVFIDPDATAAEVRYLLSKADVKLMFAEEEVADRWVDAECTLPQLRAAAPKKKLVSRWLGGGKKKQGDAAAETYPAVLDAHDAKHAPYEGSTEDLALILYTSGTTGGPKLVPLTRGNLEAQAGTMTERLALDEASRVLNLMPITHVDGLLTGILVTFMSGSTMLRLEPFTMPKLPIVMDAIYKHRATHAILVPTLMSLMLRDEDRARESFDTEDFRFVVSTASSLAPELWKRFEDITGKPVANMYGMSEIGNLIFSGPDESSRRIGSIGLAFDCETLVVDDEGRPVAAGAEGELLIAGPSVTPGYLGTETPSVVAEGTNWFPTGDLVIHEETGHLKLVGRKKDLIITGGRNVAPDEVNQALLEHPSVIEAATFGVEDDTWGERILSCAVTDGGATDEAILAFVSERLASFKVPRELHVLPELPKGRSGKVQTAELKKRVAEGVSGATGSSGSVDVSAVILDVAAKSFRTTRSSLSLATRPDTCQGWDSMAHLDFVCNLERALDVTFGPRDIMRMQSLSAVADIAQGLRAGS